MKHLFDLMPPSGYPLYLKALICPHSCHVELLFKSFKNGEQNRLSENTFVLLGKKVFQIKSNEYFEDIK